MRLSIRNWLLAASLTSLLCLPNRAVLALPESAVTSPSPPITSTAANSNSDNAATASAPPPFVNGKVFLNGILQEVKNDMAILHHGVGEMKLDDVYGCCTLSSTSSTIDNNNDDNDNCPEKTNDNGTTNSDQPHESSRLLSRTPIGTMPQFTKHQSLHALQASLSAWKGGSGTWPQMPLSQRIASIQTFVAELHHQRDAIVQILMWEIGKNRKDAEAEFDRTVQFIQKTIQYIQTSTAVDEFGSEWDIASHAPTRLFTSRAAIGIVLCLGPYNYPLNETYATLIPALLMGNVVLLKIPTVGGLAHLLTMEAFAKSLPEGTIQLISGAGRVTMPPLMESGKIDSLAFIGGSRAADLLIKAHPEPHRLKLFLQLEAKNMGVYMPDLFHSSGNDIDAVDWEKIMGETIAGTLSYNGQRCTALKLLFVPKEHSNTFATMLAGKVENLSVGLPWESSFGKYSQITPLPNQGRVNYMKELIDDAIEKGATILNKNGGTIIGGPESTLMIPAVLYPVTSNMRIYEEEQFGPIIPVAPYDSLEDVLTYARDGKYGQQVSIFTSSTQEEDTASSARLIDQFSTIFGKININSQCGRSPDTAAFSGRRSSAMGVMSVREALMEFSIPTVVSYKEDENIGMEELVKGVQKHSKFLQSAS